MKRRLQVADSKERDTGFEPATSTLATWKSIESKQQLRLWQSLLNQRKRQESRFAFPTTLNAVILRYTFFERSIAGILPEWPANEESITTHGRPI
jgi:hypothetical protein